MFLVNKYIQIPLEGLISFSARWSKTGIVCGKASKNDGGI